MFIFFFLGQGFNPGPFRRESSALPSEPSHLLTFFCFFARVHSNIEGRPFIRDPWVTVSYLESWRIFGYFKWITCKLGQSTTSLFLIIVLFYIWIVLINNLLMLVNSYKIKIKDRFLMSNCMWKIASKFCDLIVHIIQAM